METNPTPAQEQPAQLIALEATKPEQQPTKPLYNSDEAAEIVKHLTRGLFDPEYILLFGKLAGGTPDSAPAAYDILMVTRETLLQLRGGLVHGAGGGLLLPHPLLCFSRQGVRHPRSGGDARADADALVGTDAISGSRTG